MDPSWITIVVGILGGLLVAWLALIAVLWVKRPDQLTAREAARLLPDLLRLFHRLATDPTVPRGVRIRLWLLLAYLAFPVDLVPDFLPVIGYADDVVLVAIVLHSVVRHAGQDVLARHWPGTPSGLAAVRDLAGIE